MYLSPGSNFSRVYDVPSDCLRPLNVVDASFGLSADYKWRQERGRVFTDVDDAGLRYLRLEDDPTQYDEMLVEVMAARLAWMIGMRIHSDKQLRAETRAEMDRAIARAKVVDAAARYESEAPEPLWTG